MDYKFFDEYSDSLTNLDKLNNVVDPKEIFEREIQRYKDLIKRKLREKKLKRILNDKL